jgi:hypothetical protein
MIALHLNVPRRLGLAAAIHNKQNRSRAVRAWSWQVKGGELTQVIKPHTGEEPRTGDGDQQHRGAGCVSTLANERFLHNNCDHGLRTSVYTILSRTGGTIYTT